MLTFLGTAVGIVLTVVVAVVILLLLAIWAYSGRYIKVGPNQALIAFGRGSAPRVITGGGTLVVPIFEHSEIFSLELMSFDVAPQQNLYTNQGVAVRVDAVTQLKVRSDRDSILTAAEQFLSKTWDQRQAMIRLVMEGHLRGIVGQLTVEQLVKEPEMVSEKMRNTSSADLAKMGLEVVSFTIREVRDENEYITTWAARDRAHQERGEHRRRQRRPRHANPAGRGAAGLRRRQSRGRSGARQSRSRLARQTGRVPA